jgi:hypothetical protein
MNTAGRKGKRKKKLSHRKERPITDVQSTALGRKEG